MNISENLELVKFYFHKTYGFSYFNMEIRKNNVK